MSAMNKKRTESTETLKKVLRFIGRYRILLVVSIVLAAASVLLQLYVPILFGNAKINAQGLGVADVQKAVRLGRKARANVIVAPVCEVLVDKFLDKIGGVPLLSRHTHDLLAYLFEKTIRSLYHGCGQSNSCIPVKYAYFVRLRGRKNFYWACS